MRRAPQDLSPAEKSLRAGRELVIRHLATAVPQASMTAMTDTMTNRIIIAGATIHHAFLVKMVSKRLVAPWR